LAATVDARVAAQLAFLALWRRASEAERWVLCEIQ